MSLLLSCDSVTVIVLLYGTFQIVYLALMQYFLYDHGPSP